MKLEIIHKCKTNTDTNADTNTSTDTNTNTNRNTNMNTNTDTNTHTNMTQLVFPFIQKTSKSMSPEKIGAQKNVSGLAPETVLARGPKRLLGGPEIY